MGLICVDKPTCGFEKKKHMHDRGIEREVIARRLDRELGRTDEQAAVRQVGSKSTSS